MKEIDLEEEARRQYDKSRDRNINKAYNDLSEEEKRELREINEELLGLDKEEKYLKEEIELKKRIAMFSLSLVNKTPQDRIDIMETSYILTSFIFQKFEDELDEVFDITGSLELPEEHVDGNVFELWKEVKERLEDYLSKSP